MSKFIYALLCLSILASCGQKSPNKKKAIKTITGIQTEVKKSSYYRSYDFTENGCATGKREFTSNTKQELDDLYCEGLQNNELNNYCASFLRKMQFENVCDGRTWTPF